MLDDLRRAVNTLPGLVWSAHPDGAVDFLNRRWCEYTGLTVDQGRGWGWQDAVHPDELARVVDWWRSAVSRGQPDEIEVRLRRSDGIFRWFLVRVTPLRDDDGRIVKWYGDGTDIEDRKRAEALLDAEKRLLEMVAAGTALDAVLTAVCDVVDRIDSGSSCSILQLEERAAAVRQVAAPRLPAALSAAIDGRPIDAPYFGPCAMAIHERRQVVVADIAEDPRWQAGWRELALAHGLRSCWTTPILSREGRALGTFALYRREAGEPTARHQELTERLTHIASIAIEHGRTAAELHRSRAHLAEAQRLSATGSFTWRVATGEILWSEQAYRIYDVAPRVPVTFDLVFTRIHPDEAAWFQELLTRASLEGRDLEFEHRLLMPDRSIKYLHVVAHATRDHEGRLEYVGAVQDVTERRRSDDALDKLRSDLAHVSRVTTLGALTASIAHEVNQPLSGIVTNASTSLLMLSADPPDVTGAIESADRTIRDANRAAAVIARLRSLFGKAGAACESFDLNEAVREVLALCARELDAAGVWAHAALAEGASVIVVGDRVQLQQVVLNLVLNATEAMRGTHGRPRQLVIRTEEEGEDRVRLLVHDTGPGIAPRAARRLFDAFYTTKPGGMGIGLSISRTIIERHRGRIWAESREEGGATFGFAIPRVAVPERRRNLDDPPPPSDRLLKRVSRAAS